MNRYFVDIKGFENYSISKKGVVYSKRKKTYIKTTHGYVTFSMNNKKYIRSVNALVKSHFYTVIEKPNESNQEIADSGYKPIVGFEDYLINRNGDIWSTKSNKILKQQINSGGYKFILLSKHFRFVHRLVYETWIGEIKNGYTIDHIDENKQNNNVSNLQQLTRSENTLKFNEIRFRKKYKIRGYVKIENFDSYFINSKGDVISFKYGQKRKVYIDSRGGVYLSRNGKRKRLTLSKLIKQYFNI